MRQRKRNVSRWFVLLLLLVLCTCSKVQAGEITGDDFITAVVLNAGTDETQLNVTWYANTSVEGVVQIGEAWSPLDEDGFPTKYQEIKVTSITEVTHTDYTAEHDSIYDGWYSNKATIDGLKRGVEYYYRVGNDGIFSETYSYKIYGDEESFGFIYSGDPQLDNDKDVENTTVKQWKNTMSLIRSMYPQTSLLVLGGDLANSGSEREYQYSQGLMAPQELRSLALGTSVGNHDEFGDGNAYRLHFNQPNQTEIGSYRDVPGDYWYKYNNVLFIHLTTSNVQDINTSLGYVDSHVNFIRETLEANQDCDWHILVFHESLFSQATHSGTINTRSMRNRLVPKLAELDEEYGIDLALSAHDHSYSRTYTMQGLTPLETEEAESDIVNPDGIIYVTANTGSGIKYYDSKEIDYNYLAVRNQEYTPNISYIQIDTTANKTSLTMTTYRTGDGEDYTGSDEPMSVVDEFTITKTSAADKRENAAVVKDGDAQMTIPSCYAKDKLKASLYSLTSGTIYNSFLAEINQDEDFQVYKPVVNAYGCNVTWKSQALDTEEDLTFQIPLPSAPSGYSYITDENSVEVYTKNLDGSSGRIYGKDITITTQSGKKYALFKAKNISSFAVVGKVLDNNYGKALSKPSKTTITSLKKKGSGAIIKFKQVKEATSYEIYRYDTGSKKYVAAYKVEGKTIYQYKSKTWKKIGTATLSKKIYTATLKNAKSGKYIIKTVKEKTGYTTTVGDSSKAVTLK